MGDPDVLKLPSRDAGDDGDLGESWTVTPREIAEHLGIHVETVYEIPYERLRYIVVNGRGDRKYRASDVKAYIENHLRPGPAERPS